MYVKEKSEVPPVFKLLWQPWVVQLVQLVQPVQLVQLVELPVTSHRSQSQVTTVCAAGGTRSQSQQQLSICLTI